MLTLLWIKLFHYSRKKLFPNRQKKDFLDRFFDYLEAKITQLIPS